MHERTEPSEASELRALLRGELAAVETYGQAIERVKDDPALRTTLQQCQVSHQKRCTRLERELQAIGLEPDQNSGVWGSFAKFIEGSASWIGPTAALAALEEGELHGLRSYQDTIEGRDASARVRNLVACELLEEQRGTQERIRSLCAQLRAAASPGAERNSSP